MKELNSNKQKENTSPKHMSIRSILGGDILANDFFKRQTSLLILIMVLTILYIDNRYTSQQELIEYIKNNMTNSTDVPNKSNGDKLVGALVLIWFFASIGSLLYLSAFMV